MLDPTGTCRYVKGREVGSHPRIFVQEPVSLLETLILHTFDLEKLTFRHKVAWKHLRIPTRFSKFELLQSPTKRASLA